ncbi:MAG: S24 family peptidase, partial [Ornithinibacter sp.]
MIRDDTTPYRITQPRRGIDAMSWQLPLFAVLVQGPSMAPTLRSGDALLVRRSGRVRHGAVVVARFRSRPGLLVVKRAVREQ